MSDEFEPHVEVEVTKEKPVYIVMTTHIDGSYTTMVCQSRSEAILVAEAERVTHGEDPRIIGVFSMEVLGDNNVVEPYDPFFL